MKGRWTSTLVAAAAVCTMVISTATPDMVTSSAAAGKSIKLNKSKVTITKGKTYTLKVKVKPAKLKSKVSFVSSNKKIAKVSKKGIITGIKSGKADITAKVKGTKLKAVCKVTVKKSTANKSASDTVASKDTQTMPTATPATTVTATATPEATQTPTVDKVTAVRFNEEGDTMEIQIGESYELKTEISPAGSKDVTYSSDRDWVASVDNDGKVSVKYPGIATITVESKSNPQVKDTIKIYAVDNTVPEDGFNKENAAIAHGTIDTITFASDYTESGSQQARVWKPHDYSVDKQYNVLYCLHGGGGNMWYWTNDKGGANDGCSADKILDNIYAEGIMEDAIVVFPNGSMPYDQDKVYPHVPEHMEVTPFAGSVEWFLTEYEVIYNLMPYIKDHYSVYEGKEHTAVCGLSMGCGQTLELGLNHSDIFGYVGAFSGSPFKLENQIFVNSEEDADKLNSNLKLFAYMVGSEDGLANAKNGSKAKAFADVCRDNGLNFMFVEEPGLAHEDACWDRNLYKFMKYAFK